MKDQADVLFLTVEHLKVLSSVACSEVMTAVSSTEPRSAQDLAKMVGRSPASVLEHIQKLLEVGLVIPAGTRQKRSRTEQLYLSAAKIIRFSLQDQSTEAMEAYVQRVRGRIRLAERSMEAAFQAVPTCPPLVDFILYKTYNAFLDKEGALRLQLAINEALDVLKRYDNLTPEQRESGEFLRYQFLALGLPTTEEVRKLESGS